MIEYYIQIFNKPTILWSFLEETAVAGLFIFIVAIIVLMGWLIDLIIKIRNKRNRRKNK